MHCCPFLFAAILAAWSESVLPFPFPGPSFGVGAAADSRGGAGPSVRKGVDGADELFTLSGDDRCLCLGSCLWLCLNRMLLGSVRQPSNYRGHLIQVDSPQYGRILLPLPG